MRLVDVYAREGSLFVQASSANDAGIWYSVGCVHTLPLDSDDVAVGRIVRLALAESGVLDTAPPSTRELLSPLVAAAGVRSYKAFAAVCRLVTVEQTDRELALCPMENRRGRGTFFPVAGANVTLPVNADDTIIGRELRTAFDLSL